MSVWLSVDPWADKYPYVTPYNFVENNPINLVDPTGLGPGWWDNLKLAVSKTWHSVFGNESTKDPDPEPALRMEGSLLATVDVHPPDNTNPRDNTHTSAYNDYANAPEGTGVIDNGPSVQDRTKQADAVERFLRKHLDMDAVRDMADTESFSGRDKYPQWLEGITESFDGPDYELTGDSILTFWSNNPYGRDDTRPMVRPYVTGGGVRTDGRPGNAKDTLNKSTEKAKEYFR